MSPFSHLPPRPLMGIVNVTPDSFSDTGTFLDPAAAAAHARLLAAQGAAILDLGAEASSFFRPGILPVPADEQLRRLLPVLELLRDLSKNVLISIDTRSAIVARAALRAGAAIINDISAGTHDPDLLPAVAQAGAAIILMHISPNYPATPAADDPGILATVRGYLETRASAALAAGIPPDRIALDPGIGFGKTMPDNWRLALRARELSPRFPLVLGTSRKRFLDSPPPPDAPLPKAWPTLLARLTTLNTPPASPPAPPSDFSLQPSTFNLPPHPRDPASAALAILTANNPTNPAPPPIIHRLHNIALARSD